MTETTIPDLFAEFAGVQLTEFEDGLHRWGAVGHVTPERMAAAIHAYEGRWPGASDLPAYELTEGNLERVWAVIRHADGADDDDGWYFHWDGVTWRTEGAFRMTLVLDGPPARK